MESRDKHPKGLIFFSVVSGCKKVKSAYKPKWPVRLELILVFVALSD